MSTLRFLLRTAVPAVLLAAGLAACGGSSSTSSSATAAQTSSSPSASSSATTTDATSTTSTSAGTNSASTTTATAGAAALSGCPTASLRLTFVSGQGAAGTAFMTYALTNIGHATCTLIGFPGVSIVNASGAIVQHPAQRGGIETPVRIRLVTLARGRQARFIVTSSDVIPSPGCPHAFSGAALRVFPPNQRQSLSVPHTTPFCNLHVGPVEGPH